MNFYRAIPYGRQRVNEFYYYFQNIYKVNFIETVDINKKRNFVNKPWISIGVAKSCEMKNKLHKLWIKSRGTNRENTAKQNYFTYRSKLRDIIKIKKQNTLQIDLKNVQVI